MGLMVSENISNLSIFPFLLSHTWPVHQNQNVLLPWLPCTLVTNLEVLELRFHNRMRVAMRTN